MPEFNDHIADQEASNNNDIENDWTSRGKELVL